MHAARWGGPAIEIAAEGNVILTDDRNCLLDHPDPVIRREQYIIGHIEADHRELRRHLAVDLLDAKLAFAARNLAGIPKWLACMLSAPGEGLHVVELVA